MGGSEASIDPVSAATGFSFRDLCCRGDGLIGLLCCLRNGFQDPSRLWCLGPRTLTFFAEGVSFEVFSPLSVSGDTGRWLVARLPAISTGGDSDFAWPPASETCVSMALVSLSCVPLASKGIPSAAVGPEVSVVELDCVGGNGGIAWCSASTTGGVGLGFGGEVALSRVIAAIVAWFKTCFPNELRIKDESQPLLGIGILGVGRPFWDRYSCRNGVKVFGSWILLQWAR